MQAVTSSEIAQASSDATLSLGIQGRSLSGILRGPEPSPVPLPLLVKFFTPIKALSPAWNIALILGLSVALGLGVVLFLRRPALARNWVELQAVMPKVSRTGSAVRIDGIRDFQFTSSTSYTPGYISGTYDADSITSAWFLLTPFAASWRGPAHSFVSFGFADGRYLSISVEARREVGEEYSGLTGMLRRFEIMYVFGTERDLVGQRAAFAPYPVYLYPIRADRAKMKAVFLEMTDRAASLARAPEFYNTLTNNCTSNLVSHVNHVAARPIPSGLKTVLPGYIDEVALSLGLLDTSMPIDSARSRFLLDPSLARASILDPAFSSLIRSSSPRSRR